MKVYSLTGLTEQLIVNGFKELGYHTDSPEEADAYFCGGVGEIYKVEGLLAKKDQVKSERVAYLAKLFDGMKQDEISKLMAQLDDNTIVAVLPKMKAASASKVLAMLPPERAARITTIPCSWRSRYLVAHSWSFSP